MPTPKRTDQKRYPKKPTTARAQRDKRDRNDTYRDGVPALFSTTPKRRTDDMLVALATTGPMKAVDVIGCVGRRWAKRTVYYLSPIADLGVIVLVNPGTPARRSRC